MKGSLPQSVIAIAPRISLALLGLMVSVPFLNFHHSLPLPTFYTEWMAFALGTAALLTLAFIPNGQSARIPLLSLGLLGLTLVLLIQVAAGTVAYVERSLLGMLYLLWAAMLVGLAAQLREQCGIERVTLVLQVFIALGGFLAALTGFILYYGIDFFGYHLVSGTGADGMYGSIAQRNHFANYLACALASVVFLYGRRRLAPPIAALLALPIILALVLSISRSAWIYVTLVLIAVLWTFGLGDRKRLKPFAGFAFLAFILFVCFSIAVAYTSWFAGPAGQTATLGDRWAQTLTSDDAQTGVLIRTYLLHESWRMFTAHPFLGVGFGEFAWNLLERGAVLNGIDSAMTSHAHNAALELLAEVGSIGMLCVAAPLALWLRAFPWGKPGLENGWLLTLIAIQGAHSMVEYPLWYANFLGLAVVLLGVVAQPGIKFLFNRFRQAALTVVLAAGIFTLADVFFDYRRFEQWYRQADASQKRGSAISTEQLSDLADQRATSLFAGYYDLLASELLLLNREELHGKLELNARVLRFIPIPTAIFRQAILLNLVGDREEAARTLSRLSAAYPNTMRDMLKRLEQMAQSDPSAFGEFAAEARRKYGPDRARP